MLILTDRSEQRALENKMEQEWQRMKMSVTVAISLELFQSVLKGFTSFVATEWKAIWRKQVHLRKKCIRSSAASISSREILANFI